MHQHSGAQPLRVLELGPGYGTTAAAMANAGHAVIATEWLRPGGRALIDVGNPFVWAGWHGDEELQNQHEYLAVLRHES